MTESIQTHGRWTSHYWMKIGSKQKLKRKLNHVLEFNENENTIYPNIWDTMKAGLTWNTKCLHLKKKKTGETLYQQVNDTNKIFRKTGRNNILKV